LVTTSGLRGRLSTFFDARPKTGHDPLHLVRVLLRQYTAGDEAVHLRVITERGTAKDLEVRPHQVSKIAVGT